MMKEIEVLPPTIVDGVPIPRKVAYVEDGGGGCGCLIAVLAAAVVILAAILGSGCAPTYTVIPADREVVPVKAADAAGEQRTENGACSAEGANLPRLQNAPAGRRMYVEAEEGATGWYVPDATMLELLEAD